MRLASVWPGHEASTLLLTCHQTTSDSPSLGKERSRPCSMNLLPESVVLIRRVQTQVSDVGVSSDPYLYDKNTVTSFPALKLGNISLQTRGAFYRTHFRTKNSTGMQRFRALNLSVSVNIF